MARSTLYLSRCKTLAGVSLILAGCASGQKVISNEFDGTLYRLRPSSSEPLHIRTKDFNFTEIEPGYYRSIAAAKDADEAAAKLLSYYCSGTQAKRNIRTKVKYVVPKTPPGLPVDQAAHEREQVVKLGRDFMEDFFYLASQADPHGDNFATKTSGEIPADQAQKDGLIFYALESNRQKDLVELFKKTIPPQDLSSKLVAGYSLRDAIGGGRPLMLLKTPDAQSLLLTVKHPDRISEWAFGSALSLGPAVYDTNNEWRQHLRLSGLPRHIFFTVGKAPDDDKFKSQFPLGSSSLAEIRELREAFTMMIPKEVQKEALDYDERKPVKWADRGRRNHLFGYNKDGELSPVAAIEDRESQWAAYMEKMTTISEAPDPSDPQIINFEASLNLELFCRYQRPVKSLMSQ